MLMILIIRSSFKYLKTISKLSHLVVLLDSFSSLMAFIFTPMMLHLCGLWAG